MSIIPLLILISFTNGFAADSCNFDVRLAQALRNQGLYSEVSLQFRNITYHVTFANKYGDSHLYEQCYIGLDQILPAGVYAYPDELGDLQRMNKLTAIPKNKVNVELPAEQSQPTSVYIIGKIKNGEVNLWLPVHARYHKATKGGGFFRNEIEPPRIFIRCPQRPLNQCEPKTSLIKFLCNGNGNETCVWKEVPYILLSDPVIFMAVPLGNLDHKELVGPMTVGAVIICSLYLLKTLHEYKLASMRMGIKH